jgi:large subunit ribosomal protein L4
MASLDIVTIDKKKAGSVELSPVVFEAQVKPDLFHAEVRRQLAKRRAGTHSTKNRAATSGGGSKPWRQKGTGRARQGTSRAPQWAGGGVVFGPVPRSYEFRLNKKMRRAALRSALSLRLGEGAITVVEEIALEDYKTKRVLEILEALSLGGGSVLIVIGEVDEKLERSARNLPRTSVLRVAGLNVYDVLRHEKLLLTKSAVAAIEARLGEAPAGDETSLPAGGETS